MGRRTVAIVDLEVKRMVVACDGKLALWMLQVLQALQSHGTKVPAEASVLCQHNRATRDERVYQRHFVDFNESIDPLFDVLLPSLQRRSERSVQWGAAGTQRAVSTTGLTRPLCRSFFYS